MSGLLVGLLGVGQFLSCVLAQVGLQKGFRFRKGEMKVGQRFYPKPQRVGGDLEQVAAMLAVGREEMEVISGYAESALEPG
jgi:hypothetical protein